MPHELTEPCCFPCPLQGCVQKPLSDLGWPRLSNTTPDVRSGFKACLSCPSWVGLAGSAGSPSWHGGSSQPRWNHLTNTHKRILEAFSKLNPSASVSCSCKGSCAVSLVHPGPELQAPIALGSAAQLYSSLPRCLGCSRGRTHPSVAWWASAEPRSVPAVHRL